MAQAQHIKSLELEISSRCPIQCPACPRQFQSQQRARWDNGDIPLAVLRDIVENSEFDSYILCGAYGDALYHSKIVEVVKILNNSGKRYMIETNGSYRSNQIWQKLAELDYDRSRNTWRFSIDGLEDTNHIYRVNSNWSTIEAGIKTLLNIPEGRRPRLEWKYLEFPYNQHQTEAARRLARQWGMDNFEAVRSLRTYEPEWFTTPDRRRQIEWS